MERISAAENITIEVSDDRWRMIANGSLKPQVLLEAEAGQPVNYISDFAVTRRLPKSGYLPLKYIQRIVVGWSPGDESWHLGLLLEADLAQARGSRWCEIARWPDPSTTMYSQVASRAGESLAQVMIRPFEVVPPRREQIQAAEPPPAPPPDLPALPLALDDDWRLERIENGQLQLGRAGRWAWTALRRTVWYGFWAVVFFWLVYASLTSGIAPPNPSFLPYVGLFAGFVLVFLTLKNLYHLLTRPDRIVFDADRQQVRGQRGQRVRWTLSLDEVESVYVSQVVNRRRGKQPAIQYAELNLHLTGGGFRFLASSEDVIEYNHEPDDADEDISALTRHNFHTNMQAAALYIAETLGLPLWYDRRTG